MISTGDVGEIWRTGRLPSSDNDVTVTVTGIYENITRTGNITVQAPIPDGLPNILGPNLVPINPVISDETFVTGYKLIQKLQNSSIDEDRTNLVKFCSSSSFANETDAAPTDGLADVTFSNPFDPSNSTPSPVALEIYTVARDAACSNSNKLQVLNVQIIPAQVSEIDSCVIVNPKADTCDGDGIFFKQDYLTQCRGLDQDSVIVPAAQSLQMVAKLTYNNPSNSSQSDLIRYQCGSPNSLKWNADNNAIFSSTLDTNQGDAVLIDRDSYLLLAEDNRESTVTASYTYTGEAGNETVSAPLTLQLTDAQVDSLSIIRVDAPSEDGPDDLSLSILGNTFDYRANCEYLIDPVAGTTESVPCDVEWTLTPDTILQLQPTSGDETTVGELDDRLAGLEGTVTLTATYNDGFSSKTATREINAIEDELVALRLLQLSETQSNEHVVDSFSCLGRDDLVGTLGEGQNYVPGAQFYFAHAQFETSTAEQAEDPASLKDVTFFDGLKLSSISGYSDGAGGCVTSADPTGSLPTDQLPATTAAADFDADTKNKLLPQGLLRLNTVCIRAYVDLDESGDVSEGDIVGNESSTVLVLPAADDNLLTEMSDLCEVLEPVLTLGSVAGDPIASGLVIPLVYGLAQIADPLLATIDGGATEPLDGLLEGLLTGDFTALGGPDAGFGLGTLTSALLGEEGQLTPLINVVDSCLATPTTSAVSILLNALLTANPQSLADIANAAPDFEACAASFGGIPDGGDGGDGGDSDGPTGTPLDVILGPLAEAFAGGGDSEGPTGTPLDIILGPLADAASGGLPSP